MNAALLHLFQKTKMYLILLLPSSALIGSTVRQEIFRFSQVLWIPFANKMLTFCSSIWSSYHFAPTEIRESNWSWKGRFFWLEPESVNEMQRFKRILTKFLSILFDLITLTGFLPAKFDLSAATWQRSHSALLWWLCVPRSGAAKGWVCSTRSGPKIVVWGIEQNLSKSALCCIINMSPRFHIYTDGWFSIFKTKTKRCQPRVCLGLSSSSTSSIFFLPCINLVIKLTSICTEPRPWQH